MIEILQSPDHVVAIRVSGEVDKQEWENVTAAVGEALEEHEQLSMYINLADLDSMTAGAVLEDTKFSLKNLGNLDQFARIAVVATADWVEKATTAGEKLLPGAETKVFSPSEDETALAWATGS